MRRCPWLFWWLRWDRLRWWWWWWWGQHRNLCSYHYSSTNCTLILGSNRILDTFFLTYDIYQECPVYKCPREEVCFDNSHRCDGKWQCSDGYDETSCPGKLLRLILRGTVIAPLVITPPVITPPVIASPAITPPVHNSLGHNSPDQNGSYDWSQLVSNKKTCFMNLKTKISSVHYSNHRSSHLSQRRIQM